jgi:hemoglobin
MNQTWSDRAPRCFWLALLLLLAFSGCVSMKPTSLYDDLGGEKGVADLTDRLIAKYRADTRINGIFQDTNFDYFRARLIEDICQRAGGGCEYKGLSMAEAHSGMQISEAEFNYFVEDSQAAMDELGLATATQNRLLAILARDRANVIKQ